MGKADLIIANSASLKQKLAQRFPGSSGRIHKVWLGVDVNRFRPGRRQESGRCTLLFAGRLIPRKGVPVLLKAVHLAKKQAKRKIKLVIAGSSQMKSYGQKMRALSRRLGVKTKFLGTVPHSRMHQVYARADCFVCPSQKHEAFGLVNVEAMASGIPVIASDIGGIREIVKHKNNGLLVRKYQSSKAFSRAIVKLVNHGDLRRNLGAKARKDCVKQFSWQATSDRLQRIYLDAVAGHR